MTLMNCFKGLFRPCSRARHRVPDPEQNRRSSPQVPTLQEPDNDPQSSFRDVKDTTLNALKLSLSLLTTISDSIPVPGLKGAFAGLQMVLELFDKADQNLKGFKSFIQSVNQLNDILLPFQSGSAIIPDNLKSQITNLSTELEDAKTVIAEVQLRTKARRIIDGSDDAQLIINQLKIVRDAIDRMMVGIAIRTELVISDSRADDLLGKLPRAVRAQHDQVDRPRCLATTRTSVLQEIKDWVHRADEQQVYWLNGAAGTGKTTIALTIADDFTQDNNRLVASFFCSHTATDRSDVNFIFPSIARSLAKRHTQFRAQLAKVVEEDETIGSALPDVQLKRLIVEPLQSSGHIQQPILIVLDALDECSADRGPEIIIAALDSQLKSVPFLKVFISSRPTSSTENAFAFCERRRIFILHNIQQREVDADIRRYLDDRLQKAAAREGAKAAAKGRPVTTQNWPPVKLVDELVKKAEGLFIFASTVCNLVERPGGLEHQLKKIVDNAAITGLDELYQEILKSALNKFPEPEEKTECLRIIGTIILLRNQLSVNALGPLLDLDPSHVQGRLSDVQSVLIVPDDPSKVIRTLHASLPEFLMDRKRATPKTNSDDLTFFIDPAEYHGHIVIDCLIFINRHPKVGESKSTFTYASKNWLYHLNCGLDTGQSNPLDQGKLVCCINELMSKSFEHWMETLINNWSTQSTFKDLDSVVCKLKSLSNFSDLFQLLRDFPIHIQKSIKAFKVSLVDERVDVEVDEARVGAQFLSANLVNISISARREARVGRAVVAAQRVAQRDVVAQRRVDRLVAQLERAIQAFKWLKSREWVPEDVPSIVY